MRQRACGGSGQGSRGGQGGQALAIVVAVVAVLTVLPIGAQLLASGQAPISGQAVERQQALEAARAGLSDYVNHVQAVAGYLAYCSTSFCSVGTMDTANPAFAAGLGLPTSTWATVDGGADGQSFQYAVDTAGISPDPSAAEQFPVYVTGRAGPAGHPVDVTLRSVLQVRPTARTYAFTGAPTGSCSSTTRAQYEDAVTVPAGATYAKVTLYGGQGGATGDNPGGGGDGGQVVAWLPATAGTTWTAVPGYAGASAEFSLLSLFSGGGPGGCGGMDFGGGPGGGSGVGLLSGAGGGGGAGSALCLGSESQCDGSSRPSWCASALTAPCLLAVAGGGGGTGGLGSLNGAVGGNAPSQTGGAGAVDLLAVACGYGGGGGGGFGADGGDGGSGGSAGLLGLICIGSGQGGAGGGSGYSPAALSTGSCTGNATSTASSYPVPGGSGPNGAVTITFYTGAVCPTTPSPQLSVSAVLTQQVAADTTS